MTTRARRIEDLFHRALELEGDERVRFLERSCDDDARLRREVEGLLALDGSADDRLDRAAPEMLALERPAPGGLIGRRLGPYLLRRCLATGGMGAVYEATQDHPHRTVAVKVLREDATSPEIARRFDVEASLLARLQHPGIAHVYEAGVAELDGANVPWIAMERVEGARTVTVWAELRGLELDDRLELFARVCDAVHHGHQRGVIHRDIKPGNVLVDAEGRPKLIDFGVARAIDPDGATRRTEAGVFLGTVQYMSPEQCVDARDLDVRSDVYSLGVLLYELVCCAPPHDLAGVPLPEAARIVRDEDPRRPSTLLRAAQGDLETILLTALAKERERRYQSAAELAADVRRYVAREPIQARAPSLRYRAALFARRQKALVASLATILVVAVGAAIVSLRFALAEQRARVREERSSTLANVTAADLLLRGHDVEGARRHLERVPPDRRGWEWRHLTARLDVATAVFPGPHARCEAVAWRGDRIASAWHYPDGKRIVVQDARTGERLAESEELGTVPTRLVLAADGAVVWGGSDGGVRRWDPVTGRTRELGAPHADHVTAIVASEGAVLSASADGSVRRWDLAGGGGEACYAGEVPLRDLALGAGGRRLALAGEDGSVRLLALEGDAEDPVRVRALRGNGSALAVAFSGAVPAGPHDGPDARDDPGSAWLAVGAADGTLVVLELDGGRELLRSRSHAGPVLDLAFLADGRLVSASGDRTIRVWDVRAGVERAVLHGHAALAKCVAVAAAEPRVASGGYDGTLRLWEPDVHAASRRLVVGAAVARDLSFSPDGRALALALRDGTASTIDVASGARVRTFRGHAGRLTAVDHDPRGARLATGSNDGTVRVWEVETGAPLATLHDFGGGVLSVDHVAGPEGIAIASGARDGTVALHDAETFELVASRRFEGGVEQVSAAPDGRRLAVATGGPALLLLALPALDEVWRRTLDVPLHDVAFAPDGRTLATGEGAYDGSGLRARLWDARSGQELRSFVGHADVVISVGFSPDGERLVTTSADGTVRLWDPRTADPLLCLREHASWVWSAEFSPDGGSLVSSAGSLDPPPVGVEVRLWSAAPAARPAAAR